MAGVITVVQLFGMVLADAGLVFMIAQSSGASETSMCLCWLKGGCRLCAFVRAHVSCVALRHVLLAMASGLSYCYAGLCVKTVRVPAL
jgi:hypothetical protein